MPDENREFYDWEQDKIREWFEEMYSDKVCPVCGGSGWEMYSRMPLLEFKWVTPLFPVHCKNCGYTRFHNAMIATRGEIKIPRDGGTS